MTMPAAPQQEIAYTALPDVDAEAWNDIIIETGKEMVEETKLLIEELFPKWVVAPGVKRTSQEWLVWFVVRINAAYPLWQTDAYQSLLRNEEIQWLLEDDYLPLVRLGQAPAPLSRPWAALMGNGIVFRGVQKLYQQVYREQAKRMGL